MTKTIPRNPERSGDAEGSHTNETAEEALFSPIRKHISPILLLMPATDESQIVFRGPSGTFSIQWNLNALDTDETDPTSMHLVSVDLGFMQASKKVYMRDEQFADFLKSLIPLHQRLEGKVSHETLEGDLKIEVEYAGGHVEVSGELIEYYSMSKACFNIETDQSYMAEVINEAKKLGS